MFYGWVANHFSVAIRRERPVVLLFDGHTTHIDVETSRLCKDNVILLYCLPAHTSHITQPLDVGLFKPLKVNWAHVVDAFRVAHVGQVMTKQVFSHMFKQAWIDTIKVHTP